MSGHTISTSETKIEAMSLQSSAYGVTIPLLYGLNRIPGNLVWYGGFKATANTKGSSGKGGTKTQTTTFSYSASVMMGLCEGQITGISRAWKGKQLFTGGVTPAQLVTVSESYTLPAAGGTFTASHAATFAASISVFGSSGEGEGTSSFTLSEGGDYGRTGGVYSFPAGSPYAGIALSVTYQYTIAGAAQTGLQQLGLSFASGARSQSTWPYLLTAFPAQAIGYSGLAMVYAQDYALGTGAQVENHTFEVQGAQAYSISSTVPDANPAPVTWDVLINARYGAAFPSTQLGSPDLWSRYCLASGLLMSPAIETQMQAGELVALMGKLTNTAPVWSAGKLKMIPYGDTPLSANGAVYTPNVTPPYDLTDDDFIPNGGDPIRGMRKSPADAFNHVRIEFLSRGAWDAVNKVWLGAYNIEIAEAKDSVNIDQFGLRSMPILKAHWICDPTVARTVAQLLMQRSLYVRNEYEFKLPWTKVMLEPMDLVTLTDPGLRFNKLPVRITKITEADDGELDIIAEDFPLGIATSVLYPTQAGAGFQHDYAAAPGSINAPVIFEAPGALTTNGLELYVAAAGTGALWGGCRVWVSLDGTSYKQIGTINGGSRYGALTNSPAAGGMVAVSLVSGALTSGSAADMAALNTLCYIGGASPEFLAYGTVTLTAALAYTLTTAGRGVYGTSGQAHSAGDPFVRVDTAVAKSGPIDLGYIGKTVHIKCTSFNFYGAAEESLANVTDYTFAITGAQVLGNAGASAYLGVSNAASDGVLSQGEKPPVLLDYANIIAEQAGIDVQALAFGVSYTAYDATVTALTAYLGTLTAPVAWNNLSNTTAIDGPTFRAKFAAVYAARQALLNATAAAAGTVANWSGVGQRPANIAALTGTESINNSLISVGGRNLARLSTNFTDRSFGYYSGTFLAAGLGDMAGGTTGARIRLTSTSWDLHKPITGLIPGGTYTVSVWVYLETAANFVLVLNNSAAWNTSGPLGHCVIAAGGWQRAVAQITTSTGRINCYLGAHSETDVTQQAPGDVVLSFIQVEQGNTATQWGYAPEDVDAGIANAGTTALWSGTSGLGKPDDNATVGATLGVNIGGQITANNAGALIAALALNTPQFAKNSITEPNFVFATSSAQGTNNWSTILTSGSIDVGAASICITIALYSNAGYYGGGESVPISYIPVAYQLLRNGYVIASWFGADLKGDSAYCLSDMPGVPAIYVLQHSNGYSGATGRRTMLLIGFKK